MCRGGGGGGLDVNFFICLMIYLFIYFKKIIKNSVLLTIQIYFLFSQRAENNIYIKN